MIKISIIIPTRNRAKILQKALDSICLQTLPQSNFEVIVVNNGSTDDTKEVVDSFLDKIDKLEYIFDDNPGLHIGRHRGLLASKGNILVYADDDIEAFPTWIEAILESFKDSDVALIGGKNLPNWEMEPPKWIKVEWEKERMMPILSILDLGNKIKEIDPYYVFGCNFSIRKNILIEAGGFHPDGMPQEIIKYRGDGESYVSSYIKDKGYKTIYNPKASVYHLCSKNRLTREYFIKRAFEHGISYSYTSIRNNKNVNLLKREIRYFLKKYFSRKDLSVEKGYLDGFKYHQKEVKKDKNLIEWVTRDNYINNGKLK